MAKLTNPKKQCGQVCGVAQFVVLVTDDPRLICNSNTVKIA